MSLTLDAWRRARGVSQEDMAKLCNVSTMTYRKWENNPGCIRIDDALLIANALKISIDDIILPLHTTNCSISE